MRIVLFQQDEVIKDLNFESAPISIGSDARSGLHLPDLRVSLEQARLVQPLTGQWMLEDVAGGERITINGRDLDQRCPLHNGDEIGVCGFTLRVAVDGDLDLGKTGKTSLDELARIREYPLPKYGEAKNCDLVITLRPEHQVSLAQFAQRIAAAPDVDSLMDATLPYLIEMLSSRMAWFGVRRQPRGEIEFMEARSADGGPANDPAGQPTLEFRCLERGQLVRLRKIADGASAIAVPLSASRGRLGMLYAESRVKADRFHAPELELLLAISNHVAARLESLLLGGGVPVAAPRQQAGSTNVLREIQAQLVPEKLPSWPDYELAVHHQPGAEHGGDVHDLLTMPNGMAAVLVANAAGDALDVCMAVNEARSACRIAALHGDPPRTFLRELHWLLADHRSHCTLSVVHVVLNPKSGALEYATAGDIGAVIVGAAGQPRVLTNPNVPRLGLTKAVEFAVTSVRLKQNDTLFMFTPGCGTVRDGSGEALGGKRLVKSLRRTAGMPAAEQVDEVRAELAAFFKDGSQPDDITMLALRRN